MGINNKFLMVLRQETAGFSENGEATGYLKFECLPSCLWQQSFKRAGQRRIFVRALSERPDIPAWLYTRASRSGLCQFYSQASPARNGRHSGSRHIL